MNDIDRYLECEYNDAEYRRYLIQASRPGLGSLLIAWAARMIVSRRARPAVSPPLGDQSWEASRVRVWTVGPEGPNVHCVSGSLWLTKTGDPRDYILVAGQNRRLEPGQWVVQAVTRTEFRVYSPTTEEVPHGQANFLSAF